MTAKKKIVIAFATTSLIGLLFLMRWLNPTDTDGGGFVRQFIAISPVIKTVRVPSDHYYPAGSTDSPLYLSSEEHPFQLMVFDTNAVRSDVVLAPDTTHCVSPERALVHVIPPLFYVQSKSGDCFWKGRLADGIGELHRSHLPPLVHSAAMDNGSFALHTLRGHADGTEVMNVLGKINSDTVFTEARETILIPQGEGLYSTDGFLRYCESLQQVIYVYFFRNEYIVMDTSLHVLTRAHTIDTIAHANLEVIKTEDQQYTLKHTPLTVNQHVRIQGTKLFVHSGIRSDNDERTWLDYRILIDVYDLVKRTYVHSFYLPGSDRRKLKNVFVFGTSLVCAYEGKMEFYRM